MGMIQDLWSEGDLMRDIAIKLILESLPASFGEALEILHCHRHEECRPLIIALQAKLPFLRKGYRDADINIKEVSETDLFPDLRAAFNEIKRILALCDESKAATAYLYFEGLRPDIRAMHPAVEWEGKHRDNERKDKAHQLMVFVTGHCNLNCSYCFSSDIERQEISLTQLKEIFQWAKREGCDIVTPCGGEPLLYSYIGDFLDMVKKNSMRTYFASNCTIPLDRLSDDRLSVIDLITFHITSSLWNDPEKMNIFCRNIRLAKMKGIDIIARANIIHKHQDIERWFEIIDQYGISSMNIALTIPSRSHDNTFLDPENFKEYVPLISRILELCDKRKVNLSFAKPLPPCIFPAHYSRYILGYENFQPFCNISEDNGTRNICISPDLTITPCLGIPEPKIKFRENLTWQELENIMGKEVSQSCMKPLFANCPDCFLYNRRICQGACLSYKY